MTIDIRELRRLAQSATPGPWENHVGHLVLAPFEGGAASIAEMMLPYRIGYNDGEIVSDRKSNAAFIAAANPATISALLDRLEATEKERDQFKRACFAHISDNALLLSKIAEMEKQEPVATIAGVDEYGPMLTWNKHWLDLAVGADLYTLPGAQPQLNEIKITLQRALELGQRETWTGTRKHRSWEDQREEQQCWNKVWGLLGAQGEEE